MAKYRLSITEISDDGTEKELIEGDGSILQRIALLGEVDSTEETSSCVEILINENLKDLAEKIVSASKFSEAARMASAFMAMMQLHEEAGITSLEDLLSDRIEGGVQ